MKVQRTLNDYGYKLFFFATVCSPTCLFAMHICWQFNTHYIIMLIYSKNLLCNYCGANTRLWWSATNVPTTDVRANQLTERERRRRRVKGRL